MKIIAMLVIIATLVLLVIMGLTKLNDAMAAHNYAEAAKTDAWGRAQQGIIIAQGQSQLDAAQASAITSAALLPWGVLGILGLLGLAIVALALVIVTQPGRPGQPVYLATPTIVYLPAPGQSRREIWQAIEEIKPNLFLSSHQER